jgi:hypothetical protein
MESMNSSRLSDTLEEYLFFNSLALFSATPLREASKQMLPIEDFARFRPLIEALPFKAEYEKGDLLTDRFLLFSNNGLDVYYIPFHYLNREARVVLVGLTPGWTQMNNAFIAAKQGLRNGLSGDNLFRFIAKFGSFSGSLMRNNLITMLDGIGLMDCLDLRSCSKLFEDTDRLAHFTSAISAPVFQNRENYTGRNTALLRVKALREFAKLNLAKELAALPNAVIIPLGRVAGEVVQFVSTETPISLNRCLTGFPHPSGASGRRTELFHKGREQWRSELAKWLS